MIISETLH